MLKHIVVADYKCYRCNCYCPAACTYVSSGIATTTLSRTDRACTTRCYNTFAACISLSTIYG